MKFVCSKESLVRVLGIAESVISTKNSILILSNVLIQAKEESLTITASETSLNFFAEIGADVSEPGELSVYCNRLFSIIRKLDSNEIEISTNSDNILSIKPRNNNDSIYYLKGIDADKFPPVKINDHNEYFSIKQDMFTDMIRKTIFSVSSSESRRFVNGVLFEKSDNTLRMVATDGKRLSLIQKNINLSGINDVSVIVPPKVLNEALKVCNGNGDLELSITSKSIYIKVDNYHFISNLLEGNFPPYQKVIPTEQGGKLVLNRKDFFNRIDRISLMGDKESHKVIFSFKKDNLKIFTENIAFGSGEENITVDYQGEPLDIALNHLFIIDVLNVINNENILLEFKDPQSTVTIKEVDNQDFIYIMMPMSL